MTLPKLRWILFFAVSSFICAVVITAFSKEINNIEELSGLLDHRMTELVKEQKENLHLRQQLEYYRSDEGMARLAREKFNLVSSGEVLYEIKIISNGVLPEKK